MTSSTNISSKGKEECSGCALCANICPTQAIKMHPDSLGFKYPVVDGEKCIDCSLCVKKCPFRRPEKDKTFEQRYYALRHYDESELLKSQSGAAFVILSDIILENGGVVYGAAFDDCFHVIHKRATNKVEREGLRYSKYTQSDIEHCFSLIRTDLEEGISVLFSGTPCQVAAIKSAIPSRLQERLYLIDLICHGVPSPNVWNDYISYIEKKYGKIQRVYFRDKRFGWNMQKETFVCDKEYSFITHKVIFHSRVCLRHSCYNCQFASYNRSSDITIGDFWGWDKVSNKHNDNKGVSLVLVNTRKGQELLNKVSPQYFLQEVLKKDTEQPNLLYPSQANIKREDFEVDYRTRGFLYVAKYYSDLNLKQQIRYRLSYIKSILKSKLKRAIGRKI